MGTEDLIESQTKVTSDEEIGYNEENGSKVEEDDESVWYSNNQTNERDEFDMKEDNEDETAWFSNNPTNETDQTLAIENVGEWKVGNTCIALWDEDNECYEAVILELNEESALVEFTGYGNVANCRLDHLKRCTDNEGGDNEREDVDENNHEDEKSPSLVADEDTVWD